MYDGWNKPIKTKEQNPKTTKEMHSEIPVLLIRLEIYWLLHPVFNSTYQTR